MAKPTEGDFIRLEFTGKDAAGNVFETTREADAKTAGFFDSRVKYGPALVAVGKGQLLPGMDEAVKNAEEGVEQKTVVPKEKAFGERNPDLVRLIPLAQFTQSGLDPVPGAVVELDGHRARVQSVNGGRVRVDFNHELAGQELSYSFKVTKIVTKPEEKIAALAEDLNAQAKLAQGTVTVTVGETVPKDSAFLGRKLRFLQQALLFIPEVQKIVFQEEYARPKETP